MLQMRRANQNDRAAVIKLLQNEILDLYHQGLEFKDFWVATDDDKIAGCLQLEECPDFFFLGSLGIHPDYQKQGVAAKLLNTALKSVNKPVYLYTIIPAFFQKFGFAVAQTYPDNLPSKGRYECDYCHPAKCVCLVKQ